MVAARMCVELQLWQDAGCDVIVENIGSHI